MSSIEIDKSVRDWWRELGFYYDIDNSLKCWRVIGDSDGIQKFIDALRQYSSDSRNATIGEHEHYGPYYYLEIGTWDSCVITDHWIAGPLSSIRGWADQLNALATKACVGDVMNVGKLFAPDAAYELALEIRAPGFDPASADPLLGKD